MQEILPVDQRTVIGSKRNKILAALLAVSWCTTVIAGHVVCDRVINKYGRLVDDNCRFVKEASPTPTYAPPAPNDGDVTRVEKTTDGRVFVHRQGRDEEEWHEVTKGDGVRVR